MKSALSRLTWIHWILFIVYGLLATGSFFKVSYEVGHLLEAQAWPGLVYAACPSWAQIAMGMQTWGLCVLVGLGCIVNGYPTMPFPELKTPYPEQI